jgi:hypothetical protein
MGISWVCQCNAIYKVYEYVYIYISPAQYDLKRTWLGHGAIKSHSYFMTWPKARGSFGAGAEWDGCGSFSERGVFSQGEGHPPIFIGVNIC